jgi:hypothetical protein
MLQAGWISRAASIKPSEVLAIGDSESDEGAAAKTLGIRFVKVEYFLGKICLLAPGNKENLENALKAAFPSVFSKDVLSNSSGFGQKAGAKRTPTAEAQKKKVPVG